MKVKRLVFKVLLVISLCLLPIIQSTAFAGCWVEDGTFYSSSKYDMATFVMAMDQGNKAKALKMVDERRIRSSTQASCVVLKREDPLIKVKILGIGQVWIYKTFLHCN